MHRKSRQPGETLTLRLQPGERSFLLEANWVISRGLARKLRMAALEGDGLVVPLLREELDELACAAAATAKRCENPRERNQWDEILVKILILLESDRDEDESGRSLEDILNSKFPPEIAERIRSHLKSGQIHDLDELNIMLSEIMLDYNRQPRNDMGGLSPEQVHYLIHADWDDSRSVFHINRDMPLDQIGSTPILHDARVFLTGIINAGGSIKTTVKGNLPRSFVHQMLPLFSPIPDSIGWLLENYKTLNEKDTFPIHIVRILLEMAGLIRKQKGRFQITHQGEKLVQEQHAGELYAQLFQIHFYHFNLAYLDGAPQNQALQTTLSYSFYMIAKHLDDWKKPEETVEDIVLPSVRESEYKYLTFQIQNRIYEPLIRFSLLECRELPKEKGELFKEYEYRKTALYDSFFRFNF